MNPPNPSLRPATPADVALALSWTPEDEALRCWAGPSTRCPATAESLWEDLKHSDAATFAFVSPAGDMLGLGQVRFRKQTYGHLARIIVSPHHRGQGLGRALCVALMRAAVRLHPITAFSLYVFPDNTNAIGLYRALGYVEKGMHPKFNCVLMEAPLTAVGPL
ncbi:MAG: N-acetyltransferase [Lacunisphaera sp.]|nr:N-acetyltransferase [Lacunisphaera sp.]